MPRGDKSSYTDKQKRQAEHIEESETSEGKSAQSAKRIAWATVNKQDGGGKKSPARNAAKKATKKSAARNPAKKAAKKSASKTTHHPGKAASAKGGRATAKKRAKKD